MNKVFRVIWSEAQGAWVAVSETTKSHSKRSRKHALALALTAGSLMTISGTAVAKGVFVDSGKASIAIDSGSCTLATAADGENSVSIGCGAGAGAAGQYPGSKADSDTSIGYQAGIGVKGKENTAIGSNAGESVIGNDNTAFGVSAGKQITGSKNVSLGFNSGFLLKGDGNISAGDASGGSIHGDNNVMLGTAAKVKGSAADIMEDDGKTVKEKRTIDDTVVIGSAASAAASDNVAIGKGAQAKDANSVALGHASVTSEAVQVTEGIITDSNKVEHTYDGFAGTASGVVSVGVKGAERQIINVAPGAITSSSTDAVNGSQLYGVAKGLNDQVNDLGSSVAGSLGGGSKYEGGKVSADLTVGGKNYTNVQDALNNIGGGWVLGSKAADGTTDQDLTIATGKKVDFNAGKNMEITSEQDADGNVVSTFKTKDDVAFTSVTTGGTVMNDNGLTITNGPSITKTGINAGDLNITNVKAGTADTHGVNVSQLKGVANVIGGVTVDENGNYTGPTFIVNGEDQKTVSGAITKLDEGWTLSDGKAGTTQVKAGDKIAIQGSENIDVTLDAASGEMVVKTNPNVTHTSVTTGNTVMSDNGLTITNGPSITKTGIDAGNQTITNVAPGEISDTSLEAINGSQLHATNNRVTVNEGNISNLDGRVTVNEGDITTLKQGWTLSDGTDTQNVQAGDTAVIKAGKNMEVAFDDDGDMIVKTQADVKFDTVTTGNTVMSDNGLTITNGPSITKTGIDAGNQTITNVAAGEISDTSLEAINGSQLNATNNRVTVNEGNISNLDGRVTVNEGDITTLQQGWTLSDGTDTQNVKAGDTATIKAGDNMEVAFDAKGDMIVKTQADVNFNSVTLGDINQPDQYTQLTQGGLDIGGNTFVTNGGLTFNGSSVAVSASGINAGGNKIINVAKGVADTDAVNVSQLETVAATAGQGWYLKVNGVEADRANVAPGETMGLTAGKNMVLTQTGTSVEFTTEDDVEFDSVTTGDTVMNKNGLTVGTNVSVTSQGFTAGDVSLTVDGINAGNKKITNVAAGTELTDGVNVSQLEQVQAQANKGWKLGSKDATNTNDLTLDVAPDGQVNLDAGKNMQVTSEQAADGTVTTTFATKADVKFDSVTLGDITQPGQYTQLTQGGLNIGGNTFVNNGGLTFNNSSVSVSANGINAGGNKIINVAKGEDDSDAVNVGQLKDYVGKNDGSWNISNGTTSSKVATGNTVTIEGGKTGTTAGNINVTHDGNGNLTIESNANVKHDNVTVGDTTINKDTGITVGDVSITTGGINAGGNQIKNVADGTELTDGVNLGQLKDVEDKVNKGWNVSTNGGSTNAINGGKTENVAPDAGVDFSGGKNIVVSQDGTDITISTADDVEFDDVKVGDVTINKDTGITVGDVSITAGGINAGGKNITGVADGTIAAGSKDAVNGGQIHDLEQKISEAGGWELSDGTTDKKVNSGDKVTIKGGDNIDVAINDDGDMIVKTNPDVTHDSVTTGDTVMNDNGLVVKVDDGKDGPSITKNGVDAGGSKVINVAKGDINADSTDAVNGSQLDATNNRVTKNEGDITNLDNRVTKTEGDITNLDNRVTKTEGDITNLDNRVTKNEGDITNLDNRVTKNEGDITNLDNRVTKNEGDIENNAGDIENIQNGKDGMFQVSQDYNAPKPKPTGKKSAAGGAGAVASGDNSTAIGNDAKATASNSTALGNSALASANNSVALGHGSVADRANSVSVGSAGAERQITNVAAGVAPTDAVNVSQLEALGGTVNQYFNAANKRIDKVDNNARAGIAAAMAAGTLPQSTLPGKSMVTVGASTYRGESALAIGVSRLSDNARTVIKANASADSRGNAGAAVGAGWHW